MSKCIWISWQYHRRTEGLCDFLGVEWFCLGSDKKGVLRYFQLAFATLSVLVKEKPSIVLVQNPSIVLTTMTCFLKRFFRYSVLVDAHNEGVIPYVNNSETFRKVTGWCHRNADLTIVTNNELASTIKNHGGLSLVLPDRLPNIEPRNFEPIRSKNRTFVVCVISTFAKDEPLSSIFLAIEKVGYDIEVFVTGNYNKCDSAVKNSAPIQVAFTGFLPDEEYWNLLSHSDVIIDLTTMKNCLVCGLYEALAVEVPIIITDDVSAKGLFSRGVIFTHLDPPSIASSIEHAIKERHDLKAAIRRQKDEYDIYWKVQACFLKDEIEKMPALA